MLKGFFNVPEPVNEPILNYGSGSKERTLLKKAIESAYQHEIDIPMYINGKPVTTDKKVRLSPPHNHQHVLGYFNQGNKTHVKDLL